MVGEASRVEDIGWFGLLSGEVVVIDGVNIAVLIEKYCRITKVASVIGTWWTIRTKR